MAKSCQVIVVLSLLIACMAVAAAAAHAGAKPASTPPALSPDDAAQIELDKWLNCSNRMGDECALKLQGAFDSQGLVSDLGCCWNLTRLGNECWKMAIQSYADPCHVLPQVLKNCVDLVKKLKPPPGPRFLMRKPHSLPLS